MALLEKAKAKAFWVSHSLLFCHHHRAPHFLSFFQDKMSAVELTETYACTPSTERGRGILISGDSKSNTITYTNARSVIMMNLENPLQVSVYGEHAYPATVARFSPNGEWVASADVSGTVRIWGTRNEFVLKKEFRVLSGRIDDLQWSPDGIRIVASGEAKGNSFVRAFMYVINQNYQTFFDFISSITLTHF